MSGWRLHRTVGTAADLHARPVPEPARPEVWVQVVSRPALVLGSTQPETDVDRAAVDALGFDVVRRRSGGGAVLLEPGGSVWVDVVVPSNHPRWVDDVGRSAHWLGDAWVRALAEVGVAGAAVHRGALEAGPIGRQLCFAGLGPGEVTVGEGAARGKVVGVSQRRTRAAARLQAIVHRRWDPELQARLLAPGLAAVPGGVAAVAELRVAEVTASAEDVVGALVAELLG